MGTTLRVSKFIHAPRDLVPAVGVVGQLKGRSAHGLVVRFALPFATAAGGTALPDERHPPYIEVTLREDEVEVVSTNEGFTLTAASPDPSPLEGISDTARLLVSFCINLQGDGRIGTASQDNLADFPLDYVCDCLRAMTEDARFSGESLEGIRNILEALSAGQPEPTQAFMPR